jgi:hypothetical protein
MHHASAQTQGHSTHLGSGAQLTRHDGVNQRVQLRLGLPRVEHRVQPLLLLLLVSIEAGLQLLGGGLGARVGLSGGQGSALVHDLRFAKLVRVLLLRPPDALLRRVENGAVVRGRRRCRRRRRLLQLQLGRPLRRGLGRSAELLGRSAHGFHRHGRRLRLLEARDEVVVGVHVLCASR